MRVLQVHNRYRDPGGEDVVVEREAAALEAAGHKVARFEASNQGSPPSIASSLSVAPWNRSQAGRITKVIDDFRPDIVHIHNTWFRLSPSVIRAASRTGMPTVMTLHNYRTLCVNALLLRDDRPCELCITDGPSAAMRFRCYHGSLALTGVASATQATARRMGVWATDVDRFVALTSFAKDVFERGGLPSDRIVVEPNRIPQPDPRTSRASESHSVLFVGRIDGLKGIDILCREWTRAQPNLGLRVLGSGPMHDSLAEQYPSIAFLGQITAEAVRTEMLSARALIVPSIWHEGLPNVIIEALGAGLPVAISSSTAVSHDLPPPMSRLAFDPHSPKDWDQVLSELQSNAAVDELSAAAVHLFNDRFADDNAESLLAVYAEAVASRQERSDA